MLPRCLRRAAAQTPEAPLLLHKFVRRPAAARRRRQRLLLAGTAATCCPAVPGWRPARRRHGPTGDPRARGCSRTAGLCTGLAITPAGRACRGCGAVPASRTGSCCHALRHTHPSRCLSRSTEIASDLRGSILPARLRLRRDSVTCRRGEGRTPGRLTRLPGGARRRAGRFDERGGHGEVRPDPVAEPFEAGRWRPAGPPGRGPRSAPGPRGSDRPQVQRRLLPGRAAAGGGAVLPADAARACCSGTSSSRCMPCCSRVLLPRAAAARAHGRREGAAPPARDARLGSVLHHLLLHSRAAPACRPGPVRGRQPGRDGPCLRLRGAPRGAGRTTGARGVRGGPPRINSRHRAQALLEAGVRRAVLARTVPPA
jgi:hypothetical protein